MTRTIELSKCTSKEQEILNVSQREDRHITVDGTGSVKIKDKEMKLEADLSNDMQAWVSFGSMQCP